MSDPSLSIALMPNGGAGGARFGGNIRSAFRIAAILPHDLTWVNRRQPNPMLLSFDFNPPVLECSHSGREFHRQTGPRTQNSA